MEIMQDAVDAVGVSHLSLVISSTFAILGGGRLFQAS